MHHFVFITELTIARVQVHIRGLDASAASRGSAVVPSGVIERDVIHDKDTTSLDESVAIRDENNSPVRESVLENQR